MFTHNTPGRLGAARSRWYRRLARARRRLHAWPCSPAPSSVIDYAYSLHPDDYVAVEGVVAIMGRSNRADQHPLVVVLVLLPCLVNTKNEETRRDFYHRLKVDVDVSIYRYNSSMNSRQQQ